MTQKIDELINALLKIKEEEGNIDVEVITFEGDEEIKEVIAENVNNKKIARIKLLA